MKVEAEVAELRVALARVAQKPVAWMCMMRAGPMCHGRTKDASYKGPRPNSRLINKRQR
jgi:hypothetical protein